MVSWHLDSSLDYVKVCNRSLLRLSNLDDPEWNLPIQFPASTNLLNDLATAMKALDGKKRVYMFSSWVLQLKSKMKPSEETISDLLC